MERDAAFRPPPQPSRLRSVGCMHLGESHGWPSREGGRGHRRSRSAPLNPGVLKSSPESVSHGPLSSPLRTGSQCRPGRSNGGNALATLPRQAAPQRDPFARHHRRAMSLRGDAGELLTAAATAAAARVHGHAGGPPERGVAPLGPMQEAVESMRRAPIRYRRSGESAGFRAIASSCGSRGSSRLVGGGNEADDDCTTGGATISNDSYISSGSSASGARFAGRVGIISGGDGGTLAPCSSFPDDVVLKRAPGGSGDEDFGHQGVLVVGGEEPEELKSVVRGCLAQKTCAPGGSIVSPDTRRKDDPRAPGLGKRRSSDSTLGVWDPPHFLPEGLNTDEEDFAGDRDNGDRSIYPLCVDACDGGSGVGDVRPVGVTGETFGAPGGSGEQGILACDDARMANVRGLRGHCSSPSDVAALLRIQAHPPSGKGDGAVSNIVSRGCDSTDEDETIRAESFRAVSPLGPVGGGGWATLGAERSEETSTEVTMVVTPSGRHPDARTVGTSGEGAFQNAERAREALSRAVGEEAGVGVRAGADGRAGFRGGSAVSRAGGMDSNGGARAGAASTAADGSVAGEVTDTSGGASGRIGQARASGASGANLRRGVGAGDDVEGPGMQRGPEGALSNGGEGEWNGGSEHQQARRVLLLDVYRERDSWAMENDWGELDDVCGLPGLSSDDAATSSVVDPALHAPQLIFRQGAIDEGDVLSLLGESRAARQAEASATTESGSPVERNISPLAAAVMRVSGVGTGAMSNNVATEEAAQGYAAGTTGGDGVDVDGGSGIALSRPGPESEMMNPSRARRNDRGRYSQGNRENGAGVGANVVRVGGGGGGGGGGGRQPVLLSLADLTAAGLEKLLRAKEGDSKMYFDPDAQRWVGEEVDLSGFEDTIPAGGNAQQMQGLGDGVSGDEGADDAIAVTADDVTVDETADECVVDLDTDGDVTTNGAVAPCSVPVAHLMPSQLDGVNGEAVTGEVVPGNSSGGHGRVSPAPIPMSTSSKRRWSSGEDVYGARIRRFASHGSQVLATSPADRRVAIGGCSIQKSSGGRLLHRRTRSADRRLEASVPLCKRRTGRGSIGRSAGGVKSSSEIGSSRGSKRTVSARSSMRGLEASRLSSGPSSASIPSGSDSGSVVRLGEEHLVLAWDESDVLREHDFEGPFDEDGIDIAGICVGAEDDFVESRRRWSGSVQRSRPPGHTHRRRVSTPIDWGIQCGGSRRRNGVSRGDRRENGVVDGDRGDDEGESGEAAEGSKAEVEAPSREVSGGEGGTNVTAVTMVSSTGDADVEGERGPGDATGLTGSSDGAGEPIGGSGTSSEQSASSQPASNTPDDPLPASSPADMTGTSTMVPERESTDAPGQVGDYPGGVRWPWVAVSTASSRTLGLEGEAASGSEMGGSENSDWDQDDDFGDLPVHPEFKLTLEKPTKFGYSPSFTMPAGVGDDGGPATSPPGDMPPFNPGLLRLGTAPASVGAFSALNRGSGPCGESNGVMSVDAGVNDRHPPVANRLLDSRLDSLGSTTEWDQTFTGELNISLAQANRSPVVSGSSAASASGPVKDAACNAAFVPEKGSQVEGDRADGGGESGPAVPEESTVKVAWEAFKAHTASGGGGGRNMGDSLRATVQAAATATSIAIEHFRKRNRSRQILEKGGGPVRRLSGPLQITLEDLEGPPAADGAATSDGGDESGTVKASFQGPPSATEGARFNREKMRWEGFQEPDLSGFITSDDEEAFPAPSPTCTRLVLDAGKDEVGSPRRTGDPVVFPPGDDAHNAGAVSLASPDVAVPVHREAETRCVGRQFGSAPVSSSSVSGAGVQDEGWGALNPRPGSPRAMDSLKGVAQEGAALEADSTGVDRRDDAVAALSTGPSSVGSAPVGDGSARGERAGSKAGNLRSAGSGICLSGDDVSDVGDVSGDATQSRAVSAAGREVLERGMSEVEDDWNSSFATSPNASAAMSSSALRLDDVSYGSMATPTSGSEMRRAQASPEGTTLRGRPGTAGGLACVAEDTVGLDHSGKRWTSMHRLFSPDGSVGIPAGFPRVGSVGSIGSVGKGSVQGDGKHDGPGVALPGSISSSNSPLMASSPVGLGAPSAPSAVDAPQGNVQSGHERRPGAEQGAQLEATLTGSAGGASAEKEAGQQKMFRHLVHRSIYPGPTRQGSFEAGDGDIHANMSHLTKSTEDDTVDDWGADFQDQIMLTPKKGNGAWSETSRGHGGEEGRAEGMDPPSPSGSPPQGIPRGFSLAASGRSTVVPHTGIKKVLPSRLGSTSLSPRRPQRGLQDFRSHQRAEFPSERAFASVWRPSFPISLFRGKAGTGGAVAGEGAEQRPLRRGHANHSPPTSGSSLYGPSVKRITMDMMGGVIGVGSLGIGFGGVFGVGGAAPDEDGAKGTGGCSSGTGDEAGPGADGDGESKGEGVDGEGSADDEREDEGTEESQGRVKKDIRRKKRSRGYQTIMKKEYTPMHVPTARINPKTGLWEPVDGYAVDMSGFGTEGSDGEVEADGARKKPLSSASSAGVGSSSSSGNASPTRGSSIAAVGLGSPGHQCESLRRRPSSSGSTGSAGSCRSDAFDLSASDRWHLVRSELAHDLAMTSFLGEQCYSRAKKRGASFLLTLPGIVSAAKSRPRSSARALPPTGRRNADARSHPSGDERPHGAESRDGLRVLTGIRRSRPTSPRALGVSFSLSPVDDGSRGGNDARPFRPSRGASRVSQRNGRPDDMITPPKPPDPNRGRPSTPPRASPPESRARKSGGNGAETPGSSGVRVGGETMPVSVTARGRTGPGSARAASRRRRSNSTTAAVSSSRGSENQGERGRSLLPWNWGGGTADATNSARARSASYTPVVSRSRNTPGVPRKPGGRSLSSSRRLHEGVSWASGSERTLNRSPPSSKDFRAGVVNRQRSASLGDGMHGGNGLGCGSGSGRRNSPRAARSTNAGTSNGSPWGGRPSVVPCGRAAPWRRLDDIPDKPFTSSPPPVPTHRVMRSPPPHPPPGIYTGAGTVSGASAFEDMSKYGGIEEAILRRGAASPPPAPISPRSIRAARFASLGRAESTSSRSRSGSTHSSAGGVLVRGTIPGTARSGGMPELSRGVGSGTAVAAMVAATAAAAVARGRESAEEEQARVERKLERFRETAEFAAAMIRDPTLRRSTTPVGGPSQSGNSPHPSRVGHPRQRASSGTSSEGSMNGTPLVAGTTAEPTARR